MQLDTIGSNLRMFRIQKKLRQEDLAEKAGVSTNYISMIERGEKIPSLETFIILINVLDVSSDMVLCDVINHGYQIKNSLLNDEMEGLSKEAQERIYAVLQTLIEHSK